MDLNLLCGLAVLTGVLLLLILLQARKPIKRGIRRPSEWPKPPQLAHFMKMEDIPPSYYKMGNAVILDRILLIYDGEAWVEPKPSACPTCGKCW